MDPVGIHLRALRYYSNWRQYFAGYPLVGNIGSLPKMIICLYYANLSA